MNTDKLTAEESAELNRLRARYAPKPNVDLTPAAKRDLELLRAGKPARLCHGPLMQLVSAGLVNEAGELL